jgi:hypothetical protein
MVLAFLTFRLTLAAQNQSHGNASDLRWHPLAAALWFATTGRLHENAHPAVDLDKW